MKNRHLEHKHESSADQHRRQREAVDAAFGKSRIHNWHNRTWQDGPPPAWLAEHAQMEAATAYRELRRSR